jgi:hypothetical protein
MEHHRHLTDTHIDTRRLVLNEDLLARLNARTSEPDHNDCRIYRSGVESWSAHIEVETSDGQRVITSVLRVAHVVAGLGHVTPEQEVMHSCCHKTQGDLCVTPEHLTRLSPAAAKRERTRHQRRMNAA